MKSPQELEGLKFIYDSTERLTAAVLIYAWVLFNILMSGLTLNLEIVFPAIISFGLFISSAAEFYKASGILELYHDIFRLGKVVAVLLVIPLVNILGVILFGVLLTYLGRNYGNNTLSLGGILSAVPLTFPLGAILSLVALKRILQNPNFYSGSDQAMGYNWGGSAPNAYPQNGQVVQVGVGRIKGGQASFRLYAYQEVYIRDIILEDYSSHATSVIPSRLIPGFNNVRVYLDPFPTLPPNTLHKLLVILSDNSVVNVMVENKVD